MKIISFLFVCLFSSISFGKNTLPFDVCNVPKISVYSHLYYCSFNAKPGTNTVRCVQGYSNGAEMIFHTLEAISEECKNPKSWKMLKQGTET
jgi:hypothetical protein